MEEAGKYNEIIRIAALDENERSFCEDVHTTEYYLELRSETDESIWMAEYMQEPFEAKGLLFPKSSLMRFKLADIAGKRPDGVIGACDTADKGDDDFALRLQRYSVRNISLPMCCLQKTLWKLQNHIWHKW